MSQKSSRGIDQAKSVPQGIRRSGTSSSCWNDGSDVSPRARAALTLRKAADPEEDVPRLPGETQLLAQRHEAPCALQRDPDVAVQQREPFGPAVGEVDGLDHLGPGLDAEPLGDAPLEAREEELGHEEV